MTVDPLLWRDFTTAFHRWTGIALTDSGATAGLMLLSDLAAADGLELREFVESLDALGQRDKRQRLIDAFVVNTTWFGRENAGLDAIVDALAGTTATKGRPLRLWSCGCSTGQEPYQLAMMLDQRGINAEIVASDISESALELARRGRFKRESVASSVRSGPYFRRGSGGFLEVDPAIRAMVSFRRHNLARSPHLMLGEEPFDGIVCRNLLIYFARDLAVRVIDRFGSALAERDGVLLLGAAEQPLVWLSDRLQPVTGYGGALLRPRLLGRPIEVQRLTPPEPRRRRGSGRVRRASRPQQGSRGRPVTLPLNGAVAQSTSPVRPPLALKDRFDRPAGQHPSVRPAPTVTLSTNPAKAVSLTDSASAHPPNPMSRDVASSNRPSLADGHPPSEALFELASSREAVTQTLARAHRRYRSKDFKGALALVDEALSTSGLHTEAFVLRGMVLKELERFEEAIAAFRSARFLEAKDAWMAVYQLGLLLEVAGDMSGAREAYRHALWSLSQGGHSGWSGDDIDEEAFAIITRDACRARLEGLTSGSRR